MNRQCRQKIIIYLSLPVLLLTAWTLLKYSGAHVAESCSIKQTTGVNSNNETPAGCTVFTIAKGDQVFFGGNDDWIEPDSYYWVDGGDDEGYGVLWIGEPDNVQQGINEKGLAYDANGLPRLDTNPHLEREAVLGDYTVYPIRIMHECATVEEVIDWVNSHQWHSYMHDQMQFADASGDAVVISAGRDGEVVFSRKPPGDGFLVSTNFNVANPENGYGYPCWRYETATQLLSELVNRPGEITYQDAAAVLDAVHTEGGSSWTIESMLADLTNGVVYLYLYHQYDQPVVINLAEELSNPHPPGSMNRFFPRAVQEEAARRYQKAKANQGRCAQIGKIWASMLFASLILMVTFSINDRRGYIFWLPVLTILGPVGLVAWLVSGQKQELNLWQTALIEAVGDVIASVLAFILLLVVFFTNPTDQSNQTIQLLFIFVVPVLIGWLLFQVLQLGRTGSQAVLQSLGARLLPAWVSANLAMGAITAVATPLVNLASNICSMMPVSPWILGSIWTIVIAGACLAVLLLMLFHGWAVRRGTRSWSVLATGNGEVIYPSWRQGWWWLLISFAFLICGVFASILIQQLI
jgi:hypothetical protein